MDDITSSIPVVSDGTMATDIKPARPALTKPDLDSAITATVRGLMDRLGRKGPGACASSHEALGLVTEEYDELVKAVRKNDIENIDEELTDIAVCCLYALASRRHMPW